MAIIVKPAKTVGVSPKAVLATAVPAISTLVGVLGMWLATGELNRSELVTATVGLSTSLLAGFAAWLGTPGRVRVDREDGFSEVSFLLVLAGIGILFAKLLL